jgi:hypothetical protein
MPQEIAHSFRANGALKRFIRIDSDERAAGHFDMKTRVCPSVASRAVFSCTDQV